MSTVAYKLFRTAVNQFFICIGSWIGGVILSFGCGLNASAVLTLSLLYFLTYAACFFIWSHKQIEEWKHFWKDG